MQNMCDILINKVKVFFKIQMIHFVHNHKIEMRR